MLFADLYAFFQEHRRCGDLDGGIEGDRVWMTCTCGAMIVRMLRLANLNLSAKLPGTRGLRNDAASCSRDSPNR
jgi:hypothetical protein